MRTVIIGAAMAVAASATPVHAEVSAEAAAEPLVIRLARDERQAIIDSVVRYFKEHPEELVEAIMAWRQRESSLVAPDDPWSGNPRGDVVAIEFFDPGCAPCRDLSARLAAVAARDGNVRVIHKEHPVSGAEAVEASLRILAGVRTGGSRDRMLASLAARGTLDRESVNAALREGGAGPLTREALSAAKASLERNRALASALGIASLPAVVLVSGDKVQALTGDLPEEEIARSVSEIRRAAQPR